MTCSLYTAIVTLDLEETKPTVIFENLYFVLWSR